MSSSTITTPCRRAIRAISARRSSDMTAPVGLWMVERSRASGTSVDASLLEGVRQEPLVVERKADEVQMQEARHRLHAGVGQVLGQHLVSGLKERRQDRRDGVLAPAAHDTSSGPAGRPDLRIQAAPASRCERWPPSGGYAISRPRSARSESDRSVDCSTPRRASAAGTGGWLTLRSSRLSMPGMVPPSGTYPGRGRARTYLAPLLPKRGRAGQPPRRHAKRSPRSPELLGEVSVRRETLPRPERATGQVLTEGVGDREVPRSGTARQIGKPHCTDDNIAVDTYLCQCICLTTKEGVGVWLAD